MLRAVLFDLDDTLFDHAGCARCALDAVHAAQEGLRAVPRDALAREHASILEALHQEVLAGRRTIDDARVERFRRLMVAAGLTGEIDLARDLAVRYREEYQRSRREVAGARALLEAVRAHAAVAIVTNNVREEQEEKLRACALDPLVDLLVASGEVGVAKPNPAIFAYTLEQLGCGPRDVVMVGDSWSADIEGARAAGIPAVWFNPDGTRAPDPSVPVLRALTPVGPALELILHAHRH